MKKRDLSIHAHHGEYWKEQIVPRWNHTPVMFVNHRAHRLLQDEVVTLTDDDDDAVMVVDVEHAMVQGTPLRPINHRHPPNLKI